MKSKCIHTEASAFTFRWSTQKRWCTELARKTIWISSLDVENHQNSRLPKGNWNMNLMASNCYSQSSPVTLTVRVTIGVLTFREQFTHVWKAVYSRLESSLLTFGEQFTHVWRAVYSRLESSLLTFGEQFTHFWRVVYSHLESSLLTFGEQFTHFWRAVYSHLESSLLTFGEQFAHFWRAVYPHLMRVYLWLIHRMSHD